LASLGGNPQNEALYESALGERGYIFVVLVAIVGRLAGLPETVFAELSRSGIFSLPLTGKVQLALPFRPLLSKFNFW
jgi:hypothetical protein